MDEGLESITLFLASQNRIVSLYPLRLPQSMWSRRYSRGAGRSRGAKCRSTGTKESSDGGGVETKRRTGAGRTEHREVGPDPSWVGTPSTLWSRGRYSPRFPCWQQETGNRFVAPRRYSSPVLGLLRVGCCRRSRRRTRGRYTTSDRHTQGILFRVSPWGRLQSTLGE